MQLSLGDAARRALESLMQNGTYEYQSEFAKKYYGQGKEKGRDQALREVAQRLLDQGMTPAKIAQVTGLPEIEVRRLAH